MCMELRASPQQKSYFKEQVFSFFPSYVVFEYVVADLNTTVIKLSGIIAQGNSCG